MVVSMQKAALPVDSQAAIKRNVNIGINTKLVTEIDTSYELPVLQ